MDLKETLSGILADLEVLTSELILISGSVLLLIAGLTRFGRQTKLLVGALVVSALFLLDNVSGRYFNDFLILDPVAVFLKYIFLFTTAGILLFDRKKHLSEFYFLVIAVLVGSMFMVSVTNLLLIYISIELTSYAAYLLTGIDNNQKSSEAAFKYLLFGGVSSALMLYGISLIYGSTLSLNLEELQWEATSAGGLILLFAGLLFKTSVVPFHIWTPGTYQAAPTDAVTYFSIVPKLAGFGLIYHVINAVDPVFQNEITILIGSLSIITILWGTFGAILQKNAKRLISYGAIAHSGFLLPLVFVDYGGGIDAFGYYALIYAVMNLGIFYFLHVAENELGDNLKITDFSGLGGQNGIIGASVVVILVSLIGLPPTAGFTAKLVMFTSVWMEFKTDQLMIWLALFVMGLLSSVVSLYFYFRIPYYFFLKQDAGRKVKFPVKNVWVTTIFALSLLYLFIQGDILDNFVVMFDPIDHQNK